LQITLEFLQFPGSRTGDWGGLALLNDMKLRDSNL
jgi:hypothetical protein